jgi:hypothetical protein
MSHTLRAYKAGELTFSQQPLIDKNGIFEVPIGTIMRFKKQHMKVSELKDKSCQNLCNGCVVQSYLISAEKTLCDGLACFQNFRVDGKSVILEFTNEAMSEIHSGAEQTELAL